MIKCITFYLRPQGSWCVNNISFFCLLGRHNSHKNIHFYVPSIRLMDWLNIKVLKVYCILMCLFVHPKMFIKRLSYFCLVRAEVCLILFVFPFAAKMFVYRPCVCASVLVNLSIGYAAQILFWIVIAVHNSCGVPFCTSNKFTLSRMIHRYIFVFLCLMSGKWATSK